jgi:hypothetical protein
VITRSDVSHTRARADAARQAAARPAAPAATRPSRHPMPNAAARRPARGPAAPTRRRPRRRATGSPRQHRPRKKRPDRLRLSLSARAQKEQRLLGRRVEALHDLFFALAKPLGGRLNRCRRLAKDWENLNRKALAFLRLASIRLMLRKLCNQP